VEEPGGAAALKGLTCAEDAKTGDVDDDPDTETDAEAEPDDAGEAAPEPKTMTGEMTIWVGTEGCLAHCWLVLDGSPQT